MSKRTALTAERLAEFVRYEPRTGRFVVVGKMRGKRPGDDAGFINPDGYRRITVDGRQYGANRLAFLAMTGRWPEGFVDHRDGDPGNDRWKNLREADRCQNMANRKPHRGSTSGVKGVYPSRRGWVAIITWRGHRYYLGWFASKADAAAAYQAKAAELHGDFAYHRRAA